MDKSQIITDIRGGKLRLTKTRLTELTGESYKGLLWFLSLAQVSNPKEINGTCLKIYCPGRVEYGDAFFQIEARRIGCRNFDRKTFNLILKTAKALRKKVKVGNSR